MGISVVESAKLYKKLKNKIANNEDPRQELADIRTYNGNIYPARYYADDAFKKEEDTKIPTANSGSVNVKEPEVSTEKETVSSDMYEKYRELLENSQSSQNRVIDQIEQYLESLGNRYEELLSKLDEGNYRDYELYEDIVADYTALGERMAKGAVAGSAASNSGNIDTLSAANAHRQMLSYKNAGENAAREAYSEDIQKSAEGLKSYASDLGEVYSLLSESANRLDDKNIAILDAYKDYLKSMTDRLKVYTDLGISVDEQQLDPNSYANRMDQYMGALIALYPSYGEEIQNMFHHI